MKIIENRGDSIMEETRQEKTYGVAFAGEEETTIYNSFVKELTEWAKDGSLPESGNQDIAYYLELQQNWLKERNIRMEYRFSDRAGKKGTPRFQMTDLFPKVTDFHYSDYEVNLSVIRGIKLYDAFVFFFGIFVLWRFVFDLQSVLGVVFRTSICGKRSGEA